jgi:hypothetical protein
MIINKKMLMRDVSQETKYLFSYLILKLGFNFFKFIRARLGSLLSLAHLTLGVRYETTRYI